MACHCCTPAGRARSRSRVSPRSAAGTRPAPTGSASRRFGSTACHGPARSSELPSHPAQILPHSPAGFPNLAALEARLGYDVYVSLLRYLTCAVTLLLLPSCGGQSSPHGDAGDVAVLADDPSCRRIGISYRAGCDGCPSNPISCPCFDDLVDAGFPAVPLSRCNAGHCVVSVDCAEICAVEGATAWTDLERCVTANVCRSDAWCATFHGKCLEEKADAFSWCTSGAVGVPCVDPSDCWSNICAAQRCQGVP
jgi:hypothetical protein